MQQILRDEWGFKYLVVSDCGAVTDFWENHKVSSNARNAAAKGVLAGTDVECGFNYVYKSVPEAVKYGALTEEEVDKHVIRLLEGRFDKMIVNPFADKSVRKPNVIQSAFADFFNDINVVRDDSPSA